MPLALPQGYFLLHGGGEMLSKYWTSEFWLANDKWHLNKELQVYKADEVEAEIEHYRDAIEVLQSARDCMLAGFTTMAASYQQGKMALRRIPDLEREIERLQRELEVEQTVRTNSHIVQD